MNPKTIAATLAAVFLAAAMNVKADIGTKATVFAASAPDAEETCLIIICCNSWRCYWKDL